MSFSKLFSSQIYKKPLIIRSKQQFLKDLVDECYKIKRIDVEGNRWSQENYLGGYTSYSSYSNLHTWSSTFAFLENKINDQVIYFLNSLGYETKNKIIKMTNFWVNIMGYQTTHSWHIHPRSIVSGTFYVQVPKDSVGIKFEDPRFNFMMSCLPKRKNLPLDLQNFVAIKPKNGELVLFESWMRHEVPPNSSKLDRISVSFNYEWLDQ